jgi:hypothetical protein
MAYQKLLLLQHTIAGAALAVLIAGVMVNSLLSLCRARSCVSGEDQGLGQSFLHNDGCCSASGSGTYFKRVTPMGASFSRW